MEYARYRLDNGYYWGGTTEINDDPECGYTTILPPALEEPFTTIAVWKGDHWQVEPLT